jgi:insertion element IS1 protein InsB
VGENKNLPVNTFYSDHWKSYNEFVPENKLVQTKTETSTIEGYNSRIRYYLARFKRKTKCYSKTKHMYGNIYEIVVSET